MKISRIYANKNFKNIKFHDGFNAIVAYIESENRDDTHNLGKTSLIRVIDFLLLSSYNKKTDKLLGNDIFAGQEFYGEFKLNNGEFLIIKRPIDTATKISFKINKIELVDFQIIENWDEILTFKKARERLNEYLGFDVLQNWPYRKSITYFLRSQQDYLDVFKLNKFKGKHKDWKPFVFDLLGFNGNLIWDKLEIEEDIEILKKKILTLKQEAKIESSEKDKLEGLLDIKLTEFDEAKRQIDKFNFYEEDLRLNSKLVERIDLELQALNTERYRVTYEIKKIKNSLSEIFDNVDQKSIDSLFREVNLYYPEKLKKEYEDLIRFQKSITAERKEYLSENLDSLEIEYRELNKTIQNLEDQKSEYLAILTEKDTYYKFKEYQKRTVKAEVEISRIKDKLAAIDNSIEIENKITKKRDLIQEKVTGLKTSLSQRKHADINKIFNFIIKEVINTNALISLKLNSQDNVDFNADYQNKTDLLKTAEGQGTTYKKLLCVAFDLSLLIHYSRNSFYKFVYHDGVLEGLDDRIKIRFVDLIKKLCVEYNIQYIITLIDSDLPKNKSDFISTNDVCLRLNDKNDNGKLFLNTF